ncbi:MAG: O-antigen ligase family protein [Bacillota bacterium]|nr:O-antigen ligase family protein [Bacillota bacterium]
MDTAKGNSKFMFIGFSYILLQPFLDLLTSLSLHLFEKDLTISLLTRMIFLIFAGIYLLFFSRLYQKNVFLYFGILFIFFVIQLMINHSYKPTFHLFEELKYMVKLIYFVVVLIFYYVLFKQIPPYQNKTIHYLVYASTIIGLIMLVSGMTGTAFSSYEGGKEGNVGWFYAGNELGAILAMSFPIVVLSALLKSRKFWISAALLIYSLLALGTKVGYGAIVMVLVIALIMSTYNHFLHKKNWGSIVILVLFLICTIAYTPFSPLAHNLNIHLSWLGVGNQTNKIEHVTNEQVENLVYSGREKFLSDQKQFYLAAPLSQKLFGMGYGGNYQKNAKLIEMDFYDVFFSFGMIGVVLYFIPIVFLVIRLFNVAGMNLFRYINTQNALMITGIILGFGISFTAGHVLTAPAVSIYLALLLSYFVVNLEQMDEMKKV